MSTTNTANSQININIPGEDSVISLLNSYVDLNFDVVHAVTINRYADGVDINLLSLGLLALFSNYTLATSSGKFLEDNGHAHIVSLMYKLKTSAKDLDYLSIGFDRSRDRRQQEITNDKNQKRQYHVRIMLSDVFRSPKDQQKGTFGLGYKLTITRNVDKSVLNKDNATVIGKIKINSIEW